MESPIYHTGVSLLCFFFLGVNPTIPKEVRCCLSILFCYMVENDERTVVTIRLLSLCIVSPLPSKTA